MHVGRLSYQLYVLALVLLCATPVHAGYRNLLLAIDVPWTGVYHRTDIATLTLMTQWQSKAYTADVWVEVFPPTGTRMAWRFHSTGILTVPLVFNHNDPVGIWYVAAHLVDLLPDGTGDGDAVTFHVQ